MSFGMVQSINKADAARRDAERKALRSRAKRLIAEKMPDLVEENGQACSFAVFAVLTLWARDGEGNAKPSEVRRYRAGHLTRIEDRSAGLPVRRVAA